MNDLRAEDSQAKCGYRQVTQSVVAIVGIVACVGCSTKTAETSVGSSQDRDGDETTDEEQIEDDEQPAEEFGSATFEAEVDNQSGDGVGCCSCKNALDCAGGVAHILYHPIDLI
jgi:hypothetical protein